MPKRSLRITGTSLLSCFAISSKSASAAGGAASASTTASLLRREEVDSIVDGEYRAYITPPGGFIEITRSSYDLYKRNGFKFHLSVDPTKLEMALNAICPLLTSKESPVKLFKIAHPENIALIPGAPAKSITRFIEGAQITIYCHFDDDLTTLADFLLLLSTRLTKLGIAAGTIPVSDLLLGRYLSGRCEVILEENGASNNPNDIDSYIIADEVTDETRLRAHLFYFVRLCFLAEEIHEQLAVIDPVTAETGRAVLSDFLTKHRDSTASHLDLIRLLYLTLNEIYKDVDTSLLAEFNDFSELFVLLNKYDSSQYNKPSPAYLRIIEREQRRCRLYAAYKAAKKAGIDDTENSAAAAASSAGAGVAKDLVAVVTEVKEEETDPTEVHAEEVENLVSIKSVRLLS